MQNNEINSSNFFENNFDVRIFLEFVIGNVPYLVLFLVISIRRCLTADVGWIGREREKKGPLKIRIVLTSLFITVNAVLVLFSFLYPEFWLYSNPLFSLLYFFQILILIYQIQMFYLEFHKSLPSLCYMHNLFWICSLVCNTVFLLDSFFMLDVIQLVNLIVDIVRVALLALLVFASLFLDNDPKFRLKEKNNPVITGDIHQVLLSKQEVDFESTRHTREDQPPQILIVFKNAICNHPHSNEKCYQIEVTLSCTDHRYKIYKTVTEFMKLERKVTQELHGRTINISEIPVSNLCLEKMTGENENLLKSKAKLESYLKSLLSETLITFALIDFLEIPEPQKLTYVKLITERDNQCLNETMGGQAPLYSAQNAGKFQNLGNDIMKSSNQVNRSSYSEEASVPGLKKNLPFEINDCKKYCSHIEVNFKELIWSETENHYELEFEFQLVKFPQERWRVTRRYEDFRRLNQSLKNSLKVNLPTFPKKLILNDEKNSLLRARALEDYLRIMLNERVYFNTELFEFIDLKNERRTRFDPPEERSVSQYKARITEVKIEVDKETNKPYNLYEVIIECYSQVSNKYEYSYQICKRYSEFHKLNEALYRLYSQTVPNYPSFPSKFNLKGAYKTKVLGEERKEQLQVYLNEIFKLPSLEECFEFRKFLELEPRRISFI